MSFAILRAGPAHSQFAREAALELQGRASCDAVAIAEFLSDSSRYLILAIEGGRVIGCLDGYSLRHPHRREPQFLLYGIDVRPECRNRGVGRGLVEQFIAEARSAGAFEVWVLTSASNHAAMALYARCGLRRENPDDVMLVLPLRGAKRGS